MKILVFISFPLIYFFYIGGWHTKFIRYMTPTIPFLIISASYFLHKVKTKFNILGNILIIVSVISTIIWAFAFFTIYTKEQTRISASIWIYKNIPLNSKILQEHWDDGLPIPLTNFNPSIYSIKQLTIYEPDNYSKVVYYSQELSKADYIVINSRRLYGTLINLPKKYPVTSKYYDLLFKGQLGYIKVAEFSSYPNFFGFEINDDLSEETFQVYDHPKVMIFRNQDRLNQRQLISKLMLR